MKKIALVLIPVISLFCMAGMFGYWGAYDSDTIEPKGARKSIRVTSAVMGTSASGLMVVSDGDGVVLTSADWGKIIWMTGAGEVQLPDGGASDIGKYIMLVCRDASEQVEIALTDATELIVLQDGTALDAGDEADMLTSALSRVTVAYMETGKWYIISGFATDGGAAD